MKFIVSIFLIALCWSAEAQTIGGQTQSLKTLQPQQLATPFIRDDDVLEIDGVSGLAVAEYMHIHSQINLLAVMVNSSNVYAAPAVWAMLNANGLSSIPIGAYQGSATPSASSYTQQLQQTFGKVNDTRSNYTDATTVYCQVLNAAAPNSVVIASTGFMNNLASLLQSSCTGFSSSTGMQLVAAKVKYIVQQGGNYPTGSGTYNFSNDPADASYVFANCPVPIYSLGDALSASTNSGPLITANTATSPIAYAFNLCYTASACGPPVLQNGRYVRVDVDLMSELVAARNLSINFTFGGYAGTNTVNATTGNNAWTSTAGKSSYLTSAVGDPVFSTTFNQMIDALN